MPWDFEELYTYMVRNDELSIKNLLCRGVDIDSRGNLGQSLLHEAAKSGNIQIARLLIQKFGADVEALNDRKQSPLWLAAESGQLPMVASLFQDYHADSKSIDYLNRSALHVAASKGHILIVRFLVEKCHNCIDAIDYLGRTPLYIASFFGHSNVAEWLIDYGANIFVRTRYGSLTNLHGVAVSSKTTMRSISVLISRGANPLDTNSSGDTPLHTANSEEFAKTLLESCFQRERSQQNRRILMDLLLVKNAKNETAYESALRRSKSANSLESQSRIASLASYLKWYFTPFAEKEAVSEVTIRVSHSIKQNKLQMYLAGTLLRTLEFTPIHILSRTILSYLTPMDLMMGVYDTCHDTSFKSKVDVEDYEFDSSEYST